MPVKPGYKMTEVGVVPGDWKVIALGEVANKIGSGITPTGGSRIYKSSGRPFVRSQNIGWGVLKLDDITFIDQETHDTFPGTEIVLNDSLLNITGASIGRCALADFRIAGGNVNQHVCIIRTSQAQLDSGFLTHCLLADLGQKQIDSFQSGGNRQGLNFSQIGSMRFALPSKVSEQTAIAQTLSDVDALIEALSATLAKKRDIKQATMQQLLTGKTRLPGFSVSSNYKMTEVGLIPQDWEVRLLPEICRFRAGKAHEQVISDSGTYVCVNSKFISTDGVTRKYATRNFCIAKKDDILMVMSDLPNGKALAKTFLADHNDIYAVNQRVCALTTIEGAPGFLRFLFNRNTYFLKFDDGVSQTHLLNRVFLKFQFAAPRLVSEQLAISQTLTDLDAELSALEARIDKTRALKLGMMQELLTGRTRLI